MNTVATPSLAVPAVLTVDIEDASMVRDVKKAISMLRGVTQVRAPRRRAISGLKQSERDIAAGRVETFKTADDMFRSLGI